MWTLFELPDRGRFLLFAVGFLNVLFVLFVIFVVPLTLTLTPRASKLPSKIRQEDITNLLKPRGQDPGEEDPIDEVALEGEGVELGAAY